MWENVQLFASSQGKNARMIIAALFSWSFLSEEAFGVLIYRCIISGVVYFAVSSSRTNEHDSLSHSIALMSASRPSLFARFKLNSPERLKKGESNVWHFCHSGINANTSAEIGSEPRFNVFKLSHNCGVEPVVIIHHQLPKESFRVFLTLRRDQTTKGHVTLLHLLPH